MNVMMNPKSESILSFLAWEHQLTKHTLSLGTAAVSHPSAVT